MPKAILEKRWWHGIGPRVLSSQCELCRRWCKGWLCADCLAAFDVTASRCERCALRLPAGAASCTDCQWRHDGLATCLAVVSYQYPWQTLLAAFKYKKRLSMACVMADLALQRPSVRTLLSAADVMIGMPLSAQRIQGRGYNQAHEWARRLDAAKTRPNVLLRCQHSPAQAGLSQTQRQLQLPALSAAFQVDPTQRHWIFQRQVVLIDDVQTTGTTLHAAAVALRRAGASQVHGLTFARTERDSGQGPYQTR